MQSPGHVDIVIGAELMEAGRAIQRGLVTPDRTTLIASTQRSLAVKEKMVPGDGISDSDQVYKAARVASKRFITLRHGRYRGACRQLYFRRHVWRPGRLSRSAAKRTRQPSGTQELA
jgi:hypothetical protein